VPSLAIGRTSGEVDSRVGGGSLGRGASVAYRLTVSGLLLFRYDLGARTSILYLMMEASDFDLNTLPFLGLNVIKRALHDQASLNSGSPYLLPIGI
jgi:hypothetical protein